VIALAQGLPAPAACSDLSVHSEGREARLALLGIIAHAQHTIDVCTFILGKDAFGEDLLARLCSKARSGVRVRLLPDGFGSLLGEVDSANLYSRILFLKFELMFAFHNRAEIQRFDAWPRTNASRRSAIRPLQPALRAIGLKAFCFRWGFRFEASDSTAQLVGIRK